MNILRINSTGPNVELLQSILKQLGFYNGNIDGMFGVLTENAVKTFQQNFGLSPDGMVGSNTWNALSPYINGYTMYRIKAGDTLYSIAQNFGTTVASIRIANPNIPFDHDSLQISQMITVPLRNIVPTNIRYTYQIMQRNISSLLRIYPFLENINIGTSVLGNQIPCIRFGRGTKQVFYCASFHANEWITSVLFMKFLENICKAYVNNSMLYDYDVRTLFENVSLYLAPMINPDGVNLVTGSYAPSTPTYHRARRISNNYPGISFPDGWKANINGVDLNLQFPAGWENARRIKYSQGFTSPAPRDFVGFGPLTEPEALAVYNFTLSNNFRLMLTYHTQGKEIYWQFLNYAPAESLPIANLFSEASGYSVTNVPYESGFAGYKDWFLQAYSRPGFTIEAGFGINPLPISQFQEIYNDNLGILVLGMVL